MYDFDKVINRRGTNSEKWDMKEEDILPMWVADMDFKAPEPVVDAIIKRAQHGVFGYSFYSDSYYDSIVKWQEKRNQWKIKREWIMYSPGVVPAINILIKALTRPGDKIIIQPPVYYPFFKAVHNNNRELLENPLIYRNSRYTMDFEDLEEKAKDPKAKLLILCSPHNPVGRVWTRKELTRLGEICLKNNITVISDEIHSDLIYKGHKHTPFASISEEFAQNSIVCTAPSKTFNLAALKTSCIIICNERHRKLYKNMMESIGLGEGNVFGAVALEAAYTYGDKWLSQLIDYLEGNLQFLKKYIAKNIPEIEVVEPEGTYVVWLDCRKLGMDAKSLEDFMLTKAKLWLDEGYIFGKQGEGFERINIACPRDILKEGLFRLERAIKNFEGNQ